MIFLSLFSTVVVVSFDVGGCGGGGGVVTIIFDEVVARVISRDGSAVLPCISSLSSSSSSSLSLREEDATGSHSLFV